MIVTTRTMTSELRDDPEFGLLGKPLSVREHQILELVAEGLYHKEIAQQLGISRQTVKNHMTSILRKLGASNARRAVYLMFCTNAPETKNTDSTR